MCGIHKADCKYFADDWEGYCRHHEILLDDDERCPSCEASERCKYPRCKLNQAAKAS
jgi:hypothetical protein